MHHIHHDPSKRLVGPMTRVRPSLQHGGGHFAQFDEGVLVRDGEVGAGRGVGDEEGADFDIVDEQRDTWQAEGGVRWGEVI